MAAFPSRVPPPAALFAAGGLPDAVTREPLSGVK
jgi:hypothetical protein